MGNPITHDFFRVAPQHNKNMSDIEKYVAKLSEDQSFAKQVGEIVESNEGNEIFNQLTALGKEHGLNVSAEELEEARKILASQAKTEGEMDEEQLEEVSGGSYYAPPGATREQIQASLRAQNRKDSDPLSDFCYGVVDFMSKW